MTDIYFAAAVTMLGFIQYHSNKRDYYNKKRKK